MRASSTSRRPSLSRAWWRSTWRRCHLLHHCRCS
jgi:hypothetical protein